MKKSYLPLIDLILAEDYDKIVEKYVKLKNQEPERIKSSHFLVCDKNIDCLS